MTSTASIYWRDYVHIQTACGMDDQALEFFAWGARSWECGGSNVLPEEHLAIIVQIMQTRDTMV